MSLNRIIPVVLLLLAVTLTPLVFFGEEQPGADPAAAGKAEDAKSAQPMTADEVGECSPCHRTSSPSMDDLLPNSMCRRPRAHEDLNEKVEKVPEVIVIDQLSELYVPVVFPHGLHAQMGDLGEGCGVCHHHGKEGEIVACQNCHAVDTDPANLRQPGLKGAYHRQCLSCHREWSHDTACIFCHAKRTAETVDVKIDPTDITGRLHPNVSVPEKKVYPTPELEDGTMVTFFHKDHVDLFGKRCVDCHQKENCSRCHDSAGPQKHVRQDPHEDCEKCHDTQGDCTVCHMDREAEPFDHNKRTPFMLKPYHAGVGCRDCHKEGKFAIGKKACGDCHEAGWLPENFDHAKAGLVFNEAHKDNECEACHPNGLGAPPDCTVCHDDKKFPGHVPGETVPPGAGASADAPADAAPEAAAEAAPEAAPEPAAGEENKQPG